MSCKEWPKYLWLPPVELYYRLAEARLGSECKQNTELVLQGCLTVLCSLAPLDLYLIQLTLQVTTFKI